MDKFPSEHYSAVRAAVVAVLVGATEVLEGAVIPSHADDKYASQVLFCSTISSLEALCVPRQQRFVHIKPIIHFNIGRGWFCKGMTPHRGGGQSVDRSASA